MMKTERPAPLAMPRNRLIPFVLLLSSCVSPAPIGQPSASPSTQPSTAPTSQASPSVPSPATSPSAAPTPTPVASPSFSASPSVTPTSSPIPTASPSSSPSTSSSPISSPSPSPSASPSPSSGPIVNPGESPAASASPNLGTTSVIGTIRAKDGPLLTGVAVQIRPVSSSVKFEASTTSVGGNYRFDNVPIGQQFYVLTIKSGYNSLQRLTTTQVGAAPEARPVNFDLIAR